VSLIELVSGTLEPHNMRVYRASWNTHTHTHTHTVFWASRFIMVSGMISYSFISCRAIEASKLSGPTRKGENKDASGGALLLASRFHDYGSF
jgi:hypothetical protein